MHNFASYVIFKITYIHITCTKLSRQDEGNTL